MGAGTIARRTFLGLGIAAVGGLAVGYYFYRKPIPNPLKDGLAEGEATFNPYVKIAESGEITVIAPRAEMGQGVSTTLAALVAEELDVGLDQVTVEHGPASHAYYSAEMYAESLPISPFEDSMLARIAHGFSDISGKLLGLQVTGGSTSTIDMYDRMRVAGVAARVMLVEAAMRRWGVDRAGVLTDRGEAINRKTGERLPYGALALAAAKLEPPESVRLRDPRSWKILGESQQRTDARAKVTGAPVFGIDVELPGMLYAAIAFSPRFGARPRAVNAGPAKAITGVRDVVRVETAAGNGVAVVADNTWAAFRGADALEIEWSDDVAYPETTEAQFAALSDALNGEGFEMGGEGDAEAAFAAPDGTVVEAEYRAPYLAHACMEPMNATAQLADGKLTLWIGSQAPNVLPMVCGPLVDVASENVEVHNLSLGGGFGRRGEGEMAMFATLIAKETEGRPVKLTYRREDDVRHDMFRPAALGRFRAVAKPGVGPQALEMRVASPALMKQIVGRYFPWLPIMGPDKSVLDGLFNQPYAVPNARYEGVMPELGVPVGAWRSVGNSFNGFFHECFFDEIAEAAGMDPVEMRLGLLQDDALKAPRKALERVAAMAGWGETAPGRGKGIALVHSFGTTVAEVVEVEATDAGIRILNVWCAADLGQVLDPGIVTQQMESGIIYGLSSAMMQAISLEGGAVVESNFHDYDAMRLAQCPRIEVELLQNAPRMGGAGEPGLPPSIPALANAIHAATGKRLRETPFDRFVDFA